MEWRTEQPNNSDPGDPGRRAHNKWPLAVYRVIHTHCSQGKHPSTRQIMRESGCSGFGVLHQTLDKLEEMCYIRRDEKRRIHLGRNTNIDRLMEHHETEENWIQLR
jgi:hypothetical protein